MGRAVWQVGMLGACALVLACEGGAERSAYARGVPVTIDFDAAPPPAPPPTSVFVSPPRRTWEPVLVGTSWWHELTVGNVGTGPLAVRDVRVDGADADAWSVRIDELPPEDTATRLADPDEDGVPGLSPGARFTLRVFFAPAREGPHTATVRVETDDATRPVLEVPVDGLGAASPPCDPVEPPLQRLAPTVAGTTRAAEIVVRNCDVGVLNVLSVDSDDPAFAIPEWFRETLPRRIRGPQEVGDQPGLTVPVEFTPDDVGTFAGRMRIVTDDPLLPEREARVEGAAIQNECPVPAVAAPRVSGALGRWVRLDASASSDPEGSRLIYRWAVVEAPPGSRAAVREVLGLDARFRRDDPETPDAALVPDVVGRYRVRLDVVDAFGNDTADCGVGAFVVVDAGVPTEGLTIALTWSSDGDPDPDDTAGADLDLHLGHPSMMQWFGPGDAFSASPYGGWGPAGEVDDALVTVHGHDGGGPEIVRIIQPESATYRLGVHYFRAIDPETGVVSGTARPRLRIFGPRGLVADTDMDLPGRTLPGLNAFWEVAEIEWPGPGIRWVDRLTEERP